MAKMNEELKADLQKLHKRLSKLVEGLTRERIVIRGENSRHLCICSELSDRLTELEAAASEDNGVDNGNPQ